MKVLLIEDEVKLAKAIAFLIKEQKIDVDICYDGKVGYETALNNEYDVIVLDIMLPNMNGLDVLKNLRQNNCNTSIIMLTAKDMIDDKVNAFGLGADDYLTKPFDASELVARIKALGRRNQKILVMDELNFEDITLNITSSTLSTTSESMTLNYKELQIIKLLILASSKSLVSKETILNKVWGWDSDASDNNVEAYMSFLRKKLKFLNSKVTIKNHQKIGYKLELTNDKKS